MNSVTKRVKLHEGGLQANFPAYKCSPHRGPPIHALTSSQGVTMRLVRICVLCTLLPFPLIHTVGYCVFILHLSYPPIETLQLMGSFELANSTVIGPHNLGATYLKCRGGGVSFKVLIILSDHVITHGVKRVFWITVPGLLHET
jgi:hypothetical protein